VSPHDKGDEQTVTLTRNADQTSNEQHRAADEQISRSMRIKVSTGECRAQEDEEGLHRRDPAGRERHVQWGIPSYSRDL
jgi:hypothetical protein